MGYWNLQHRFNLSSKATIGYIVIILSAVFTGLVNSIAKPLIDVEGFGTLELSPIMLVAMIYLINALFFTTLTKNSTPVKTIGKRNMFFLAIIGIAEVSALITYFFGLKDSTAINASILSEGEMIFSLLIAITVMRERLQRKELTPFAMIIVGMILIPVGIDLHENGFAMSDLVFGDFLILLSGLLYAMDINLCKLLSKRVDSKRLIQLTSTFSGIAALGIVISFNIPFNVDWSQVPDIVFLSIIGTGVASLFFIIALRLIGAVRTLLLYSSSAAFGVIFSSIFLGEQITAANVVSIGLVVAGIYFLRNRLAEDESDEEDIKEITQNPVIYARKPVKKYSISRTETIPVFAKNNLEFSMKKTISKIERKFRLWFLYQQFFKPQVFSDKPNVYRCHLGRGISKIFYHEKISDYVRWKSKSRPRKKVTGKLLAKGVSVG